MRKLSLVAFVVLLVSSPELFAQDPTFEEQSLAAFRTANLTTIENLHCPAYESNPSNAQAAFGCFFVRTLRLFESRSATQALALLGEPAINLQRDVFDPANPDALCTKLGREAPIEVDQSWFQEFPNLPFNNYRFRGFDAFGRELLVRLRNSGRNAGASFSAMRNYLSNLDTNSNGLLTQLIALLAVPRATPDFRFTIPREICPVAPGMQDIVVRNIDLEGFHAALGSVKIFVQLLKSYMMGLNPAWFVARGTSGDILERRFVEDANGVAPNRQKFVEGMRGMRDRSVLLPLVRSTLESLITLVDSIDSEDDSYIFGRLLIRGQEEFFQKILPYARDFKNSLDHPDEFWTMTESNHANVRINVTAFFSALPNPAAVTSSDPFVVTGASTPPRRTDRLHVRPVTQFFRDLFAGFATF